MRMIVLLLSGLLWSINSYSQNEPTHNHSETADRNVIHADSGKYATLYLYRPKNAVGGLVGYNIKLDDSVICKIKNNRTFSLRLYKEGLVTIWPAIEDKKINLNVKFGESYFVKFAMVSGLVGAHPELNLISAEQGRVEFDVMEAKKGKGKSDD